MLIKTIKDRSQDTYKTLLNSPESRQDLFIHQFIQDTENIPVLYIHTPFCPSKCRYCVYSSTVPASQAEVDEFINNEIPRQVEIYEPIFEQIHFEQVYFGGGTPTILSPQQLESIFQMIPDFLEIHKKCVEASPSTLTAEHISVFQKYAFKFLSVGVQTLSPNVNQKHTRTPISANELQQLSNKLCESNLYFNYDLICFLDKGDLRDLVQFENDLRFIMQYCHPTSITIHQYYQSFFTSEKTAGLIQLLNNLLIKFNEYMCVNSHLDGSSNEILMDTLYQAEYRLVKREYKHFTHYMWNKYADVPVIGYNILSIGYTKKCHTTSNVRNMVYIANSNDIKYVHQNEKLHLDYYEIRKDKKLV